MRVRRKAWRHVPAGAHPLHAGFILKAAGRWNRAGIYGCLYTSFHPVAVVAEYVKYLRRSGVQCAERSRKRDIVSLLVDITPVTDLTDPGDSPVSPGSSFLTGDSWDDLESCRRLADYLRSRGQAGIIAPASPAPALKNLMIYIDHIPAENISITEGTDRIPL